MAVDRVEQRLRKVTAALDAAGVPYAVVGGNAVAAWVAHVDPAATRSTKDVDLLVQRSHVAQITTALTALGFQRQDIRDFILFIDLAEPSKRSGVNLVWADERLRPSYMTPSPSVTESIRDTQGFLIVTLSALVRMKLTSFRDIDKVHIADLLSVGLIDSAVRDSLAPDLRTRLEEVESRRED